MSGGIFVVVSGVVLDVVSIGAVVVESVLVLSDEPAIFFDELHAEVAIIREPAKARLKIIFFIVFNVIYHPKQPDHHLVLFFFLKKEYFALMNNGLLSAYRDDYMFFAIDFNFL
ncbi:hypothetical protein [uncultured Pedobacter sp.]|uniref:hypothetical protein n=1 Tax=uncultured Pedobacter sp. TaxID=246139 RepID=UPI0025E38EDE|nr:hypothetical protein [uncultured Pedobacter sp.]